jgi:cysteine desulfurase / selenocysteine lyase
MWQPLTDLAYLDFAATAAVRPPAVAQAVARYIDDIGATPGRGGHRLSYAAGRVALQARQRVARVLGAPGDPGRVAFAGSATVALNQAMWGVVGHGQRIVVTALDHNAVLRSATRLSRERSAALEMVPCSALGELDEAALRRALDGARLLVINAASNLLGTTLDVARLAAMAREAGALTLVDAAQLAGHVPFDVAACGVDMVAFAGHKGMLGPQGIGGLWVRQGLDLEPLLAGGTGGDSMSLDMPLSMPDRLEPGTMNGPALAGLVAGVDALLAEGIASIHMRTAALKASLRDGLSQIAGVRVLSPPAPDGVPIVTVTSDLLAPGEVAARLDRDYGVLTRAGLHCAPETHRLLGTAETGALRFSLGWSTTPAHVRRALDGVAEIHSARRSFMSGAQPGST